ncbi:MAG: tryptophan 2,3-dioxygenase [Planctomycetota bacterium]|jgi:tryptophan 2,3-dioxygenase
MTLNYSSYLKLPELLELQQAQSKPPEHDEMLFIVIHQTYELWFKLMLHELEKFNRDLSAGELYEALPTIGRCRTIMKTLVGQLDILETMTPMSFASFRDRLETSSGFQSTQFREVEFLLGYKRQDVVKYLPADSPGLAAAQRRLEEPSVVDHLYDFLEHQGVEIPADLRGRDVTEPAIPDERVQERIVEMYTTRPDLAILFERMTDFDEGLQEWRYRHVKMVERTIGSKHGTGGSPGVEFLKKSLFQPVFADLWAIRHRL